MSIVKEMAYGDEAKARLISGIDKLALAVKSTLGAGGKTVVLEDGLGQPHVTKDGVTVAHNVTLQDPVENLGVEMLRQASTKTATKAGDGTTTSTVLAQSIVHNALQAMKDNPNKDRQIKEGIQQATEEVIAYLERTAIPVTDGLLERVAVISANNDEELGKLIADAFKEVGDDGSVIHERNFEGPETYVEVVDGTRLDQGLLSPHFITNDKDAAELKNPFILLCSSEIPNLRRIEPVLGHAAKAGRPILIIAELEKQPLHALLSNKVKGVIKVNVIAPPLYGNRRNEIMEDLAFLTGGVVINEELGDDFDLITPDVLGTCVKAVTNKDNTILTFDGINDATKERIELVKELLQNETNPVGKKNYEERLAALSGGIAIVKVGANSEVEAKEKSDRVDDAIHATKAALKEGILPGGGVALINASKKIKTNGIGQEVLKQSIQSPYEQVLENAGLPIEEASTRSGIGFDAKTGKKVNMIKVGIIDPLLVTKQALINAVSVATTIVSTDCVISNKRLEE